MASEQSVRLRIINATSISREIVEHVEDHADRTLLHQVLHQICLTAKEVGCHGILDFCSLPIFTIFTLLGAIRGGAGIFGTWWVSGISAVMGTSRMLVRETHGVVTIVS